MPRDRLRGPLFSLGATGRLARAYTLARRLTGPGWLLRGRPADPRTEPQLTWRTMWQLAASLWHELSEAEQAEWEHDATPRHMTGYAWYMSQALRPNPGIYLPLAGGTMSGAIDMDGKHIHGLPLPIHVQDVWRRQDFQDYTLPYLYWQGTRVYHNADQAIATGVAWEVLAFNSTEYDTDNMHHDAVNNERITFPTAGKYLINLQVKWDADVAGRRIIGIRNQAASIISVIEAAVPGNTTFNMICTTIADVSADDWVEAICYQDSGAALDALYNAGTNCYFMAQRIG